MLLRKLYRPQPKLRAILDNIISLEDGHLPHFIHYICRFLCRLGVGGAYIPSEHTQNDHNYRANAVHMGAAFESIRSCML